MQLSCSVSYTIMRYISVFDPIWFVFPAFQQIIHQLVAIQPQQLTIRHRAVQCRTMDCLTQPLIPFLKNLLSRTICQKKTIAVFPEVFVPNHPTAPEAEQQAIHQQRFEWLHQIQRQRIPARLRRMKIGDSGIECRPVQLADAGGIKQAVQKESSAFKGLSAG